MRLRDRRARSRAALTRGTTLAAFRRRGYPALWVAGSMSTLGWSTGLVAVSWITLQVSDSSLAVGATFAARLAPALLLGMPLGALVDRFNRRWMAVAVNTAGGLAALVVAGLAVAGHLGLPELLAASLGLGVLDTLRGTTNQAYAFDLAGSDGATNAIALANLGGQLFGSIGSVIGGLVLAAAGAAPAFALAALPAFVAAASLAVAGVSPPRAPRPARVTPDAGSSRALLLRNPLVALIAIVVITGEIFGFSSITLYPTFARDVLHTDAGGLGLLNAARAAGGVMGLLALATLRIGARGGRLLLTVMATFGVGLVVFSTSSVVVVSVALLLVVGAAAAAMDTLGQSLIQRSVPDHERGAAMGIWFFSIGFGPFGSLGIGAAANAVGAPMALAVSGAVLACAALALSGVRAIRELQTA